MIARVLVLAAALTLPAGAQELSSASETAPSAFSSSSSEPAPSLPAGFSDADLEQVVRAAYTSASAFASAHGNYFARDGVFPPLRDAVAAAVEIQFGTVTIPATPAADLDAAKVCSVAPGTELRIAANIYGDGVSLVAVTSQRVFAYDYDPHKSPDVTVDAASDCTKLQ